MSVAFGTSMPSSTTVVATSTSTSPRGERAQDRLLLVGGERAVQQADARGRERAGAARRSAPIAVTAPGALARARARDRRRTPGARARPRRAGASYGGALLVGAAADGCRRRLPAARAARRGSTRRDRRGSASASVRGMGVADSTSRCGSARLAAPPATQRARCATPKRCCSSTTTRRRSREGQRRVQHRLRPDQQRDAPRGGVAPGRPRARRAGRARRERRAQRKTASRAASGASVRACCSASTSVGAISSVCPPAAATSAAAAKATAVLPLPTSPTSRRCIGPRAPRGRARSRRRRAPAPPVSAKAAAPRARAPARPRVGRRDRRAARPRSAARARRSRNASLHGEQLLQRQPAVRGRAARAERRERVLVESPGGAWTARSASRSVGTPRRARSPAIERLGARASTSASAAATIFSQTRAPDALDRRVARRGCPSPPAPPAPPSAAVTFVGCDELARARRRPCAAGPASATWRALGERLRHARAAAGTSARAATPPVLPRRRRRADGAGRRARAAPSPRTSTTVPVGQRRPAPPSGVTRRRSS